MHKTKWQLFLLENFTLPMLDVQLLRLNLLSVTTGFIFRHVSFFASCMSVSLSHSLTHSLTIALSLNACVFMWVWNCVSGSCSNQFVITLPMCCTIWCVDQFCYCFKVRVCMWWYACIQPRNFLSFPRAHTPSHCLSIAGSTCMYRYFIVFHVCVCVCVCVDVFHFSLSALHLKRITL